MNGKTVHRAALALSLTLVLLPACSNGDASSMPVPGLEVIAKAPVAHALPAGSKLVVSLDDDISSRDHVAGDAFTAQVRYDVADPDGGGVVPAGSVVRGSVTEVSPGAYVNSTGTLTLAVNSLTVDGERYDLDALIDALETTEERRGVEKVGAARTAGGTVAGAILGRVIGGSKKGTIVGVAAGAVTGATISAVVKDTDIVLPAGSHMTLTLNQPLALSGE